MKLWALAALASCSFAACTDPSPRSPGDAASGGTPAGSGGEATGGGGVAAASGGSPASGGSGGTATASITRLYVGGGDWSGNTHGKLSVFTLDAEAAVLHAGPVLDVGQLNSFAAFAPSKPYLYVADEAGKMLRSFAIDAASGALALLDETATGGGPVYVSVDSSGKFALLAYYGEGEVEVFALNTDGSLGAVVDSESTGDAAHSIVLSPDGKFAFVCNKDSDLISQFLFDNVTGQLSANGPPSVARAGGPRHLNFHPSASFAYSINELASTITAFAYDAEDGTLSELESESAVAPGFTGTLAAADLHVSADGKYLYGSNRSADQSTLVVFSIAEDGRLASPQFTSSHGRTPRNFQLAPNGTLLIAANQESNQLALFGITVGQLSFVDTVAAGTAPYWLGFRTTN